jgi:hypothetical protein
MAVPHTLSFRLPRISETKAGRRTMAIHSARTTIGSRCSPDNQPVTFSSLTSRMSMAKPCVPSRETVIALLRRSGSVIVLTAGMPGGVCLGVLIDPCAFSRLELPPTVSEFGYQSAGGSRSAANGRACRRCRETENLAYLLLPVTPLGHS